MFERALTYAQKTRSRRHSPDHPSMATSSSSSSASKTTKSTSSGNSGRPHLSKTYSSRRRSLDFLKKKVRFAETNPNDDETSLCSSSNSTLIPTPLPPIASERNNNHDNGTLMAFKPMSPTLSGSAANKFMEDVQNAIYQQQNRIGVLNQSIQQQHGIAKGRYQQGNVTGACLAMKKSQKLQRERALTLQAMQMAMDAVVEIQVAMHKAGSRAALSGNDAQFRVHLGDHVKILAEIEHLMLEKEVDLILKRQQLVELVQELL